MKPTYNLDAILNTVCNYYGIYEEKIRSSNRRADIVKARHVLFYLCVEYTDESLVKIGKFLNKNHASVIHAVKRIKRERFMYDDVAIPLLIIEKKLSSSLIIHDINLLELAKYNTLQLNKKKWKNQKN